MGRGPGRPKKYLKSVQKYVTMEESTAKFFEDNPGIEMGKALEEWILAQIPKGMNTIDYAIESLQKQIAAEEQNLEMDLRALREERQPGIEAMKRKLAMISHKNIGQSDVVAELWPEYIKFLKSKRAKNNPLTEMPENWKGDMEEVSWWVARKHPMTYNDVYVYGKSLEGKE
jgi:inhibitor of KinA sporulation pathway (predicted exonuclease)